MKNLLDKMKIGTSLLLWWVSGYKPKDSFVILLAKLGCLSHRIVRRIVYPLKKTRWKVFGEFLLSDVIARTSYGIFFCRRGDEDLDLIDEKYEGDIMNFARETVMDGDVCVDIGSNIGKYTVLFSKLAGESGRVVSIEANPKTFGILEKNIGLNGLENVSALNVACLDKKGKARLREGRLSGSSSVIYLPPPKNLNSFLVASDRLDNILKSDRERVRIIKIDVEGAEPQVLRGAKDVLRKSRNLQVVFEALNDSALREDRKIFDSLNFKIRKLSPTMYLARRSTPDDRHKLFLFANPI